MARKLRQGTRKFACHRHPEVAADSLTVERGQQKRRIKGVTRTVVNVICPVGNHEFWSAHPDAIRRAKEEDAAG